MAERDYIAEMRQVIDAETASGSYSSPIVAQHIVDKLRATDEELLQGWLNIQAVQFVRHAINLRDCSRRTHARQTSGRSVFRENAEAYEAGDHDAMAGWLTTVYVIEDGTRKPLGEMFKPDLIYVADDYHARAQENLLAEAFMRALAKKVGRGRVADHFNEEKLAKLWESTRGSGQR